MPNNIASGASVTVKALRELGVDARGLILQGSSNQTHDDLEVVNYDKKSITRFYYLGLWYIKFLHLLLWADVVHWLGSFNLKLLNVTLPVIKLLNKPGVVEFVGSDIRIPENDFAINPYFKSIFYNGYEYSYESKDVSLANQTSFADAGFAVIALQGMSHYIAFDLFQKVYKSRIRIDTALFAPEYPPVLKSKVVIAHSPTAPICKGTKHVIDAINRLKDEGYNIEFDLVINRSHKEAVEAIKACDIFVDQLILGSTGMAAIEAMAYGKPTFAYINDKVKKEDYPDNLPVVNSTIESLYSNLKIYINDSICRHTLGIDSRKYVEENHDSKILVQGLIAIYKEEVQRRALH
jgi:glycosyltransferase involved in cell wall biosynthesis